MKPAWTTLSMSKLEAVRGVKPMKPAWTTLSMFKVEAVRGVNLRSQLGPLYLCLS